MQPVAPTAPVPAPVPTTSEVFGTDGAPTTASTTAPTAQATAAPGGQAVMAGAGMEIPYHPGVDSPQDQVKQALMCAGGGYFCLLLGLLLLPALVGSGIAFLLGIVLAGQSRSTLLTYGHPTAQATTALWANWVGIALIPLLVILRIVLFGLVMVGAV